MSPTAAPSESTSSTNSHVRAPGVRDAAIDAMKTLPRRGLVSALLLALSTAACGDAEAGDAPAEGTPDAEPFVRLVNVEVETLEARTFREEILLTGVASAFRDVTVSAQETGEVVEMLVDRGASVRAGQPLFRLDDRVLRPQVDQARAVAELARETWERRRRLWEEDGVGSELAYLQARYDAEQAAANLRTLEERLARTVIRAPVAGTLEERPVELGTLVTAGTPVARVVDISPLDVEAGVPERYAPDVSVGSPVTVTFDIFPDRVLEGQVTFVGAAVTPRDRTFPVEIRIPNPGGVLKPQMVANLRVQRRVLEGAIVVPQNALVRTEEGYRAYVVEEGADGELVARGRTVEVGPSQANRAVILEGLAPGDRLVVVGQQSVADGERVRVVSGEGA